MFWNVLPESDSTSSPSMSIRGSGWTDAVSVTLPLCVTGLGQPRARP
jgi:hypothetical protein